MQLDYGQEQLQVVEAFRTGMAPYLNCPIVLYGIGQNTQAILQIAKEYHIVGLMDAETVGQNIFGLSVLSEEQVIELRPIIVIVARLTIVPVIYRRIRFLQTDYGLSIVNYAGVRLQQQEHYQNHDLDYWNRSFHELCQEIDRHDVISFDIFDTLLMRSVLRPEDIFALVENELRHRYGYQIPFCKMRITAGKLCGYAANLAMIYQKIKTEYGLSEEQCLQARTVELELEHQFMIPRTKMAEAFFYALGQGKQVFLISDMYLPKETIEQLLQKNGIYGYMNLLISCEEGAEKSDGRLFERLCALTPVGRRLHIGDNRFNDGEAARRRGLDSYLIMSAYDLLQASAMNVLLEKASDLPDRLVLGLLCAKLFHDPFSLHKTKGIVPIDTCEAVGSCFIGPWALAFIQWLSREAKESGVEQVLFPARDGYLFSQIYRLNNRQGQYPPDIYFKASRRAVTTASLQAKEDILFALGRSFQGTNGELLREWFAVEPDQDDNRQFMRSDAAQRKEFILGYQSKILEEAETERRSYLAYLEKMGLLPNKKTALFDFVAAGTVQYYLEKLLGRHLLGLYFATMDHPNDMFPNTDRVHTAYGNITSYGGGGHLGRVFKTLEALLVDGDEMLERINEDGTFLFHSKAPANFAPIQRIHKSCVNFAEDWYNMGGGFNICPALADEIIGCLFSACCSVTEEIKAVFHHDDVDKTEASSAWESE